MKRIDTSTAVPNKNGVGKTGFQDGDLANGLQPTALNAAWFNGLQEELLAVIEATGKSPSGDSFTQLLTALKEMFSSRAGASSMLGLSSMVQGESRNIVLSFTAPTRGYVQIVAALNLAGVAAHSFQQTATISTDGGLSSTALDQTSLSQCHTIALLVPKGAVVTVIQRVTTNEGPPGVNATAWLSYLFTGSLA